MAPFTAFTTVGKYHLRFVVLSKDQRTERGDNARAARLSAIERSAESGSTEGPPFRNHPGEARYVRGVAVENTSGRDGPILEGDMTEDFRWRCHGA